jgi:hypothetical protein
MNTIYCYTCSAWVLKYYHYNIDYKQWVIQYFIFKNGYFYISYRGIKTCLVFIFYTYLIIAIAIFFLLIVSMLACDYGNLLNFYMLKCSPIILY